LVESPAISSTIMVNNIRVSMMAVAFGVTAGIGTAIVLVQNGMMIGALAGAATNANVDFLFWSVILPHGVIELSAICIAGGAGFVIARALFAPGELATPRRAAIGGRTGRAVDTGRGTTFGSRWFDRGFITPTELSPNFKMAFAVLTGIFWPCI
jgi:uncharacterized membrane protein SpoIIM required for sporulation